MTVLIVEDEPTIADNIAYALGKEGFASRHVRLGRDALAALRDHPAGLELVVLDVGLPDMNGFDVCREIRRESDIPVLFLTARSDEVDRVVGLELGADDYVAKPFSPREVAARVRAILRRGRSVTNGASDAQSVSGKVSRFLVDTEGARIAFHGEWLSLTRYEYHLLSTLLGRPGRVFSRAQLMDLIWRDAEDSLERTVDAHVKTLRAKLRAIRPDTEPIETHRGLGYSIRDEHAAT